jgi:hypothetical protein
VTLILAILRFHLGSAKESGEWSGRGKEEKGDKMYYPVPE